MLSYKAAYAVAESFGDPNAPSLLSIDRPLIPILSPAPIPFVSFLPHVARLLPVSLRLLRHDAVLLSASQPPPLVDSQIPATDRLYSALVLDSYVWQCAAQILQSVGPEVGAAVEARTNEAGVWGVQ